jgi:hypothetical protein
MVKDGLGGLSSLPYPSLRGSPIPRTAPTRGHSIPLDPKDFVT